MEQYHTLFQDWLGQLVERVVRLEQYLLEREASAPSRVKAGPNVVSDVLSCLDNLAKLLLEKATFFLTENEQSVADHRSQYYASALIATDQYRRLHAFAAYIPSPWPSPELDMFLRTVLPRRNLNALGDNSGRMAWTILLSGEYNFSHILATPPNEFTEQHRLHNLLSVPAAEKDNPLMWPNLLHELAHVIGETEGIIAAAQAKLPGIAETRQTERILALWTPEIVADLIAADYVGIAYFGAFVTFATYWVPCSLWEPTTSHPSPSNRVDYLYNHLKGRPASFDTALDTLLTPYHARQRLDTEDYKARNELFDTIRDPTSPDRPYPSNDELTRYVRLIVALSEYRNITPDAIDEATAAHIKGLATQVKEGQLISSRRTDPCGIPFESPEDVRKDFSAAKQKLKELPNEFRDILNAALIRTLHPHSIVVGKKTTAVSFYGRLLSEYCDHSGHSIRKRLLDLRRTVNNLDSVISKSMEAALVMTFYQQHKRSDG